MMEILTYIGYAVIAIIGILALLGACVIGWEVGTILGSEAAKRANERDKQQ